MTVRIPYYPPLAAAAGGPFFAWLFGSLTWDELAGNSGDLLLGLVFGMFFFGFSALSIGSWVAILRARRTGLVLDESGVREISAGFTGLTVRGMAWPKVQSVSLDGDNLSFESAGETLRVGTSGLLESPQWIIERSMRFLEPDRGESARTVALDLAPLSCVSCGGRVEAPLIEAAEVACGTCGAANPLPDKLQRAVRHVRELVREIPEAHRQLGKKTLVKLLSLGLSFRQGMLLWSWITAGAFSVVAIGGAISEPSDGQFVLAMLALAGSALVFGYGTAFATRALATDWASANRASPPIEAGGPARCRLCGGDLPGLDLVRRCAWCSSDSFVMGESLESAERSALEGLRAAQRLTEQSTEAAAGVMERVAANLEWLAMLQLLWFQVPITVALDGMFGLLRLTAVCLAITLANLAAGFISLRWLRRARTTVID